MLSQEVIQGLQEFEGLYLGIDKCELVIPVDSTPDDIIPALQMQCLIDNTGNWVKKIHHKNNGYTGITGVFKNDIGRGILSVTSGCVWGNRYVKYSFNPSKLSADDWQRISDIVWNHFENGIYDLFKYGRIKRLELFVDLLNIEKTDTVTLSTHSRSHDIFIGEHSNSDYNGNDIGRCNLPKHCG